MTTTKKAPSPQPPEADAGHNYHPNYRPDIDGLRAVAILSVVLFHAFPTRLRGGFVGVDIFFVISGFLISTIIFRSLQKNDFSFVEFYAHRVKRIFPALIVVLAACYTFGWFALLPDEFKQLGKHMAAGAGFVQNLVLWKEAGYFDTASELKPLMHLWSLAIEEQFYLIFPVLIWAAWRAGLNVLTVVILLALISFGLNVSGIGKDAVKTFFVPQTRFWELLVGSVLAYLQFFKPKAIGDWLNRWVFHRVIFRHPPVPAKQGGVLVQLTSIFGLLLIILAVVALHKGKPFPGWWALTPVIGAALLIFSGPNAWVNRKILGNRLMVFVGVISYPLYLWHWPILSFARIVESDMPSREIRIAAVALSFVLAWLTYRLVERPIRFGRKSWMKTAVLVTLLAIVGYVGFNAFHREGLGFRSAANVIKLNKFDYPYKHSCEAITGTKYGDDWCNASPAAGSTPNTILLGDSFSNAYSEMLLEYSRTVRGISPIQVGRGQCPMLLEYGPEYCREITNAAAKLIASHAEIKTVILGSDWPAYFSGKDFSWLTYKETAEQFWDSFDKTIRYYEQRGKKVVVFLAPPRGVNPRACIIRPVRLTNQNICQLASEQAKVNDGPYREKMLPYLVNRGTRFFDPFPILCGNQLCTVVDGQYVLWSDSGHMSQYGGQYLARRAKAELSILAGPDGQ